LSHESGIHTRFLLSDRKTYQLIDAFSIGKEESEFVYGKHSGRYSLRNLLEREKIFAFEDWISTLLDRIKQEASDRKQSLSEKEVIAIAQQLLRKNSQLATI
jgi:homocitrate synthase NifV